MRTIDADALIEKCGDWYVEEGTESGFIGTLKNLLATMPTIQPEKAQLSKEGTTSDLISRTETVERLRGMIDVTVPITDYDGGFVDGVEVGISTVSTMPTIQPVATDTNVGNNSEIPNSSKGHWIFVHPLQEDDTGAYMCSECKVGNWGIDPESYFFCPNCGADMRGEQDG